MKKVQGKPIWQEVYQSSLVMNFLPEWSSEWLFEGREGVIDALLANLPAITNSKTFL